ncbi:hypothetical protein V1511DRAFT_491030 [Dipodascopsis uninucleata]
MSFRIAPTPYGGRGCYATEQIPARKLIHVAVTPFTSVIIRDFKKEVCAYCFKYDLGRTWKFKSEGGLWFCTEECQSKWHSEEDPSGEIIEVFQDIDKTVATARKKAFKISATEMDHDFVPEDFSFEPKDVEALWDQIEQLLRQPLDENPLHNQITKYKVLALEDVEYDSVRLVAVAIVRMYQEKTGCCSLSFSSWERFMNLESHEFDLLNKLPALLEVHIRVYIFLKEVMRSKYQELVKPSTVRYILGREAANAFGIWQLPLSIESECLGSAIFPSASYFNHSCNPNISKERVGRSMQFTTIRDIQPDEELCISYGMLTDSPVQERQKLLSDQWYFSCSCSRCVRELKINNLDS